MRPNGTRLGDVVRVLFDLGGVVIDIDFSRVFDYCAQRSKCDCSEIAVRFSMNEAYRRHEVGQIDGADPFRLASEMFSSAARMTNQNGESPHFRGGLRCFRVARAEWRWSHRSDRDVRLFANCRQLS